MVEVHGFHGLPPWSPPVFFFVGTALLESPNPKRFGSEPFSPSCNWFPDADYTGIISLSYLSFFVFFYQSLVVYRAFPSFLTELGSSTSLFLFFLTLFSSLHRWFPQTLRNWGRPGFFPSKFVSPFPFLISFSL